MRLARRKNKPVALKIALIAAVTAVAAAAANHLAGTAIWNAGMRVGDLLAHDVTKSELAKMFGARFVPGQAPSIESRFDIKYTIDSRLQQSVEHAFKRGGIPYGAFVALDAKTGQVLAMASHGIVGENLALRATFPAASIFKVVTAAAAIETGVLQHDSMIPVRGSFHTLYKQNLFKGGGLAAPPHERYLRTISFEDALAKSVNSVFGKVGIFGTGPEGLRKTASRMLFGKPLPFELPVELSVATVPDDEFGLAESASGFTRSNTLSPLHGAMLAAAVINDGKLMEPTVISSLRAKDGSLEYASEPALIGSVIEPQTAAQLAIMMRRTVTNGTSRRAFRRIARTMGEIDVGGKTGTLDGWDPPGRYDWFVGFAERGGTKIAVAALCVHGVLRGVKSSEVARRAIETYFGPIVADRSAGGSRLSAREQRAHL